MFNNCYNGKKVIILGNTGFKGCWLSAWLHLLGAKVYGLSNGSPTEPSMFDDLNLKNKIVYEYIDIRSLDSLKIKFDQIKPDFVFHLAAQSIVKMSYENPIETISTNVLGTANVLEALRSLKNKCTAVLITSDKCYKNLEWTWGYRENDQLGGIDPYSASKSAAEIIINSFFRSFFIEKHTNIKLASTRAGNVIGGGDWAIGRIVPDCIRAWSGNQEVAIRNPNATRPWQHVLEPLSGYLCLGQLLSEQESRKINGESYNFGPVAESSHSVKELLMSLAKYWDFDSISAHPYSVTPSTEFKEAGLLKLNCDKALHELNWRPILNFEKTAELTATWYTKYHQTKNSDELLAITSQQIQEYCDKAETLNIPWAIK